MKELDAKYDPTKSQFTPIVTGFYPAHVSGYSTREVKTKVGDAIVINLTYQIADEAGDKTQLMYEMDGYEYKLDDNGNKVVVKDKDGKSKSVQCIERRLYTSNIELGLCLPAPKNSPQNAWSHSQPFKITSKTSFKPKMIPKKQKNKNPKNLF